MAIALQVVGPVLQPVLAFINTQPKIEAFGEEFGERQAFLDSAGTFTRYFERIHKQYDMDTTNIKKLVKRLLQNPDPALVTFVKEETSLRDTFVHRFFKERTPLGKVLEELHNVQERPGRQLLSKEIFSEAEKEAAELTKKAALLAIEKGKRTQISSRKTVLKKLAAEAKICPECQGNTCIGKDIIMATYGIINHGAVILPSVTVFGNLVLDGTTVTGKTKVHGNVKMKNAHLKNTLNVKGSVNCEGCIVERSVSITGALEALRSTFGFISITTNRLILNNSTAREVVVRPSGDDRIQKVFLTNQSKVEGDITFEAGRGEVSCDGDSTIEGNIVGGHFV